MLKQKLQYFGHLMWRADSFEKTDAGKDWRQEEKGMTVDEMSGWHHWLDGRESQWTPGVGDGQGGLECCDSWGWKELDTTERLNWTMSLNITLITVLSSYNFRHHCNLWVYFYRMSFLLIRGHIFHLLITSSLKQKKLTRFGLCKSYIAEHLDFVVIF